MTPTMTAAAARPWRRQSRATKRVGSVAVALLVVSSATIHADTSADIVATATTPVDDASPRRVKQDVIDIDGSVSTLSDRELASRRRERRRRLGIHRHLRRNPSKAIYSRAGERGARAVKYGLPGRSTTGGDGRRTAGTGGGIDGEEAKPTPASAPASAFSAKRAGSESDPSSPRSLQSEGFDPDGIGGTFGSWWYETNWSFDSYIKSLGHPTDWSYPPSEDYQYDEVGNVFPEWFDWTEYRPIRISARYVGLPEGEEYAAKNAFLKDYVIPGAIQFWTKTLMVYPARRMYVNNENCEMASEDDWVNGLTEVDLMLYVRVETVCGDGSFAAAGSCDWDQFDKPIGGIVEFCYDSLELQADGTATPRNLRIAVETAIHELAHVLGFDSGDMAYYYDRLTGEPRTKRPIVAIPDYPCITPGQTQLVDLPAETTLREGTTKEGVRYFEVVTPAVAQASKNHFNCDSVQGIRLENQPTAGDCFGDHLEERLLWNDILSAIATTPSVPEYLSPILLALLEDTGWYRANYAMSRIVPFGHGAGCAFVEERCIDAEGNVPSHNEEFFCNTQDVNVYHCDPSHTVVANCDLKDFSTFAKGNVEVPPSMQLFDNPNLGGKTIRSDFCPVFGDYVFRCQENLPDHMSNLKTFPEESFTQNSRCFDSDNYMRPFCLETVCNKELGKVQVVMNGGDTITCDSAGQKINIGSDGDTITCPPLAVMCPELVCPANCAGRGKCKWDENPPRCECFDGSGGGESCFSYRVGYSEIDENDWAICSAQTASGCETCMDTDKSSGGKCLWLDHGGRGTEGKGGGGSCVPEQGTMCCPVETCPVDFDRHRKRRGGCRPGLHRRWCKTGVRSGDRF